MLSRGGVIPLVPANNALEFIHFTNLSKQFILFYNSKLGNELGVAQLVSSMTTKVILIICSLMTWIINDP
jgi:hypothetical protein